MNELMALLAVAGVTPFGVFIAVANASVLGIWIKGMAERRRAETEQKNADAKISGDQYDRLVKEVERLDARVKALERTVAIKDNTIAEMIEQKMVTQAENAAERVLSAARDAENKTAIAALQARLDIAEPEGSSGEDKRGAPRKRRPAKGQTSVGVIAFAKEE